MSDIDKDPIVDPNDDPGDNPPNQPSDDEAKKTIATLAAQKRHWRDKAVDPVTGKTYQELLEEERVKGKPQPEPQKPQSQLPTADKDAERDFLLYNPNLISDIGKEGIEEVFAFARGKGVRPEEALKSDGGKAIVETMRQKKRLAENTPSPSGGAPGGQPEKPFNALAPQEKKQGYQETIGKLYDQYFFP